MPASNIAKNFMKPLLLMMSSSQLCHAKRNIAQHELFSLFLNNFSLFYKKEMLNCSSQISGLF